MISAVIITKNEAHIIRKTLEALQDIVDEIVVVDSGSTDDTVQICKQYNTKIIETNWEGYSINKNKGIKAAMNDWVLSVDADEVVGAELKKSLLHVVLEKEHEVFVLNRFNYLGNKPIKYGVWLNDKHIRLFNRKKIKWKDLTVHEELILPKEVKKTTLKGRLHHYSFINYEDYIIKSIRYAKLSAHSKFMHQKRSRFYNIYFAPGFTFLKNYFFKLGFLDGWEGFLICKTHAWYCFIKYVFLKELYDTKISKND